MIFPSFQNISCTGQLPKHTTEVMCLDYVLLAYTVLSLQKMPQDALEVLVFNYLPPVPALIVPLAVKLVRIAACGAVIDAHIIVSVIAHVHDLIRFCHCVFPFSKLVPMVGFEPPMPHYRAESPVICAWLN